MRGKGKRSYITALRRIAGTLSDLSYLVVAAVPALQRPSRWWAGIRYRRLAATYHRTIARDPHYFAPLAQAFSQLEQSPRLAIDVASGTGAVTALLHACHGNARIFSIDQSAEMLACAANSPADGAVQVIGNAFHLPLAPAVADLVVTSNAPFDLCELMRVLRPGGVAVVALSSAAAIPAALRHWCLQRAMGTGVACEREITAGVGVAWIFRHSGDPPPRSARNV